MNRVLPLAALLLGSCGAVRTAPEIQLAEIESLTRGRQYQVAAELSVDLLDRLPDDDPLRPRAERALRDVSLASGLEVARRHTLADDDEAALALLDDLEERFPDSIHITAWQQRTRRKLSDRWFEIAREAIAAEHFDAARAAYLKAIEYEPDHPVAPAGLVRLGVVEEYRAGLAEDYYYDGVRTFTDFKLAESENSFEKAKKYDEDDARTKQRRIEVRREQAKARVEYAGLLIEQRRYAAAKSEFAEAARLDPESTEIADQLALLQVEAEVAATISEAESFLLRKEFDRGEEMLREAAERTTMQKDIVEKAMVGIDDSRIKTRYERALDLEHDFRFPLALAAYRSILEDRDYYEDVRSRVTKCAEIIDDAERLYGEAEAATNDVVKLELLRQIELIWPDYRDIPEQIKALDGDV